MELVRTVAKAMREVLEESAERLGETTKFVKRKMKVNGSNFCQTLVFGWMGNPEATLEELATTGVAVGLEISPQGLDYRFTEEAGELMKGVLEEAVGKVISAEGVEIQLLQRFEGVYIEDSTIVTLPEELKEKWKGCGGNGSDAAVKIEVGMEMLGGEMEGPYLEDGRVHDGKTILHNQKHPVGALVIRDLGYWSLEKWKEMGEEGVDWLSGLKNQVAIYDEEGKRWTLAKLARAQQGHEVDMMVEIGAAMRLPARLVGRRMPPEVAAERRRKCKRAALKRGNAPTDETLELCDWAFFVTSVPESTLSVDEVFVLARMRWQIELLFKLWKSHGYLDKSRSEKSWRILCECYTKLLILLIQHWLFLTSIWRFPERSLTKAARIVRQHAFGLATSLPDEDALVSALYVLGRCLAHGSRINRSRKTPRSYQLLLAFESFPD